MMSVFLFFILYIYLRFGDAWCIPENKAFLDRNHDINVYIPKYHDRNMWSANPWRNDICSCGNITNNITTSFINMDYPNKITLYTIDNKTSIIGLQNTSQYVNKNCDIQYHFIVNNNGDIFQGLPFWDDDTKPCIKYPVNIKHKWPNNFRLIQGYHGDTYKNNINNIGIAILGGNTINRFGPGYINAVQLVTFLCDYYHIIPESFTILSNTLTESVLGSIILDANQSLNGQPLCYDTLLNKRGYCMSTPNCNTNGDISRIGSNSAQCIGMYPICCIEREIESISDFPLSSVIVSVLVIIICVCLLAYWIHNKIESRNIRRFRNNNTFEPININGKIIRLDLNEINLKQTNNTNNSPKYKRLMSPKLETIQEE